MSAAGRTRRRRILVITGTRAEYGLLRSAMEAIRSHPGLTLSTLATGTHLLRKFGMTVNEITADGFKIDARVKMQTGDDSSLDQATGLARGVKGIAQFCEKSKPDVVLVLGDRIEAMAGALAAITTGRFLAQIHGGDVAPGDFDDSLRHAITKLAQVHLTATAAARRRVIKMGENDRHVHNVGAPGLDRLVLLIKQTQPTKQRNAKAVVIQHACGRTQRFERRVMTALLKAVEQEGLTRTIIHPNSDRGHTGVLQAIDAHLRLCSDGSARLIRSFDRDTYLKHLIEADVLIGNSSSGIIEAATAGTPVVNIGPRQRGRERSGRSVVDTAENLTAIGQGIRTALRKRPITGASTVYGDGKAGVRIARILANTRLTEDLRHG